MALPENCKEIPDAIDFGYNLLLTPTLQEMGMPKAMASTVWAKPLAPLGSWVERGEPLTELTFVHYRFDYETSLVQKSIASILGASKEISFSVTIPSPISGFNIVVRNSPSRTTLPTQPIFHGLIEFEPALPVLLIPEDETKWQLYELQNCFEKIASYMKFHWEKGVHNLGQNGNYKRVSIAQALTIERGYNNGTCGSALDVTAEDIEEAQRWTLDLDTIPKAQWPVCTYDEYCACKHSVGDYDHSYPLQDYISEYRSKDEKLRQKLKHLDKSIVLNKPKPAPEPTDYKYDVFISHAFEDKKSIARPLNDALKKKGVSVWFDENKLKWGQSLRRGIDEGLTESRFGIVIISPTILTREKGWFLKELDALFTREVSTGQTVLLPLLHEISYEEIIQKLATISGKICVSSDEGIPAIVDKVIELLENE